MQKCKKMVSLLLALSMVLSMVVTCSFADASEVASGTTGDCTWVLDSDGMLTISGSGAMEDYSVAANAPWYSMSSSITSVVVEEGVTAIGTNAFATCTNLTSVEIADTVTSIGGYVFRNCSSLTSIDLSDNVTSLGTNCFEGTGLTTIVIPDSVTYIGAYLLYKCTSLTTVTLGSGITEWLGHLFDGCSSLSTLYIRGDEPTSTKATEFKTGGGAIDIYYYCGTTWSNVSDGTWNSTAANKAGSSGYLTGYTITMLHDFENYNTELTTATCTETGKVYCRCGETCEAEERSLGHDYVGEVTAEPTCGATGVMTYTCSRCNESYTEVIEATGNHTWDEGTLTTAPTMETQGVMTYTCIDCGQTKEESIDGYGLTEDNVAVSFDADTGDYTVAVTYNGETLTENEDYTVSAEAQLARYELTVTVTGTGLYIGTVSQTLKLPGYASNVATVYDEATLTAALEEQRSVIILTDSFSVSSAVSVNYDVTFYGDGYTITAGSGLSLAEATAVLTVGEGAVVSLHNMTLSGNYTARIVYAAPNSSVTIGSDVTLTAGSNGSSSGTTAARFGTALYVDEGAEVTVLGTVKNAGGNSPPIYILGALNIQEGAYLTNLTGSNMAILNLGKLNWSGGTFDVNTTSAYTNNTYGSITNAGAVIVNGGTFNMSGSALLNGWLLDSDGKYTTTRSTASFGAVLNYTGATFNLSEDATIQGFDATGTAASQLNYPIAGGGVHNVGTFNMTGGLITGNASTGGSADGSGMSSGGIGRGGGVYNSGVFNMSDGEISNNTAGNGGGVYNDGEHDVAGGSTVSAGKLDMSGGTISGNTVDSDISISSSTSMGQSNGTNAYGVGSAIYVAGSSIVVISGGSITTDQTAELTITAEDGTQTTQTPSVGIAVVPTASYRAGASGSSFTAASASSSCLTITGNPEISVGILLIHISTVAKSAQLDLTTYDSTGEIAYTSVTETSRTGDTDGMAYLVLDGDLNETVELDMYVLSADATTISFNNVSATGGSYPTSTSTTEYSYNYDGALLSIYDEGVAASEDDGAHFNVSEGTLYLTTATITDENGDDVTRDAWAFCGHSEELEYVEAVAATCTTDGCIEHYVCPTCGTYFADENGETALTEEDVILSATGHDEDLTYIRAVAATCGEGGHIAYYQCASCGAMFDGPDADLANELTENDIATSATGAHTYEGTVETTKEATCTEAGEITVTVACTVCGEVACTYHVTTSATGHTWGSPVMENEVAATETQDGSYDLVYYCTDCGAELARSTVTVAATGSTGTTHTWDEGTVTVPATRYTRGIMTFTCTDEDCEETYTTYTNKINYTFLFDDVLNDSQYYFIPVYWAYDLGITSGTSATLFSPSLGCTRAQFVTFLYRLAQATGEDTSTQATSTAFTDVDSDDYFYEAVLWAAENGVTSGTSATTFTPNRTITRREAIAMLYRYECAAHGEPSVGTDNPFDDVTIDDYAYTAILWANETGVTSGTSETTFSPANTCTRAMMVTFLYNYAAIQD